MEGNLLNQIPKENKLLPPDGVYASQVYLEGEKYKGMTNIGFRPTVENTQVRNVETFLFGFEGDLYGKDIKVELLSYIRPEQKFDSIEGLKLQLLKDKETIKKWHLGKSI